MKKNKQQKKAARENVRQINKARKQQDESAPKPKSKKAPLDKLRLEIAWLCAAAWDGDEPDYEDLRLADAILDCLRRNGVKLPEPTEDWEDYPKDLTWQGKFDIDMILGRYDV